MPRMIHDKPVATEQELLDFANKIRKAGGADILDALLPSIPTDPESCLIARALNFRSSVGPARFGYFKDGSDLWVMWPQQGDTTASNALARKLAKKLRMRVHVQTGDPCPLSVEDHASEIVGLRLPKHIGNAAWAFDGDLAFEGLVKR